MSRSLASSVKRNFPQALHTNNRTPVLGSDSEYEGESHSGQVLLLGKLVSGVLSRYIHVSSNRPKSETWVHTVPRLIQTCSFKCPVPSGSRRQSRRPAAAWLLRFPLRSSRAPAARFPSSE